MKRYSVKDKTITFDDTTKDEEFNTEWTQMCSHCMEKFKDIIPASIVDENGSGICGVHNCENEADFYIDFPLGELENI